MAVQDCDFNGRGCHLVARGQAWFQGTGGWQRLDLPLGDVDHRVSAGRQLVIRVQFGNDSEDDGWLAFGTTAHPSALTVR